MKTLSRFALLVSVFNISLVTLPANSHAWRFFNSAAGFSSSYNNILSRPTLNLAQSIEEISKATGQDLSKNIQPDSLTQGNINPDSLIDDLNEDSTVDQIYVVREITDKINDLVKQISSSSLRCDGAINKIRRFFRLTNELETASEATGASPLIAAARVNSQKIVSELLLKHVAVNDQDSHGNTALMWAIQNKNFDLVKKLLEAGADITLENQKHDTAVSIAVKQYCLHEHDNTALSIAQELLWKVVDKKLLSKIKIDGKHINSYIDSFVSDPIRRGEPTQKLLFTGDNRRPSPETASGYRYLSIELDPNRNSWNACLKTFFTVIRRFFNCGPTIERYRWGSYPWRVDNR